MDSAVNAWMHRFSIASRARAPAMGGIPSLNPVDIITLCEKLRWPCDYNEAVTVLLAMDDEYRELHQDQQNQAA